MSVFALFPHGISDIKRTYFKVVRTENSAFLPFFSSYLLTLLNSLVSSWGKKYVWMLQFCVFFYTMTLIQSFSVLWVTEHAETVICIWFCSADVWFSVLQSNIGTIIQQFLWNVLITKMRLRKEWINFS